MTLLLILPVWAGLLVLCTALCAAAQRGEDP
jgi:hypothetical protein